MRGFTAADEVAWISKAIGRRVDVVIANQGQPSSEAVARYAAEHKHPLEIGDLPAGNGNGDWKFLALGHRAS